MDGSSGVARWRVLRCRFCLLPFVMRCRNAATLVSFWTVWLAENRRLCVFMGWVRGWFWLARWFLHASSVPLCSSQLACFPRLHLLACNVSILRPCILFPVLSGHGSTLPVRGQPVLWLGGGEFISGIARRRAAYASASSIVRRVYWLSSCDAAWCAALVPCAAFRTERVRAFSTPILPDSDWLSVLGAACRPSGRAC